MPTRIFEQMILKPLATLAFLSFAAGLSAQTLTVTPPQLAFDTVYENSPDSLLLTLTNTLGHDVNVTGFRFYSIYGQPAFLASRSTFTVADQTSETVWIRFAPRHNIFHNSELVIENNSQRGYVCVDLTGQGRYSNTYYDSSENRTEEDLKNALQLLTGTGYVSLGYTIARDSMFMVVDNQKVNGQGATQNTIECVYTGRLAVGYMDRTDCQTNFSFNTEHTFPQGFFSSLEPMRSDLHHLFPTDDAANNVRANYPYGTVSSPTWQSGGSKYGNSIFEPRDVQKGVSARALFYFVMRYQNYTGFLTTQEQILRTWHTSFPPDTVETARNEKIFGLQQNRNPFVDYPQFTERITNLSSFSAQAPEYSLNLSESQADYGYVSSSVNHMYELHVVNTGNQALQLTGFSLSLPSLFSFVNGTGGNATVLPGESLPLHINLNTPPAPVINGTVTFNTNIPSMPTVSIPLHADGASPVGMAPIADRTLAVYPNPVAGELVVENPGNESHLLLTDAAAHVVLLPMRMDGGKIFLDFSRVAPGLYTLHWKNGSKAILKL